MPVCTNHSPCHLQDYNTICYKGAHKYMAMILGIPGTVLFCLGVPVFSAAFLWLRVGQWNKRERDRLNCCWPFCHISPLLVIPAGHCFTILLPYYSLTVCRGEGYRSGASWPDMGSFIRVSRSGTDAFVDIILADACHRGHLQMQLTALIPTLLLPYRQITARPPTLGSR